MYQAYGVLGYPISHSLSPPLHNWAFKQKRLPKTYFRWSIPTEKLPAFMVAVRTLPIAGVSVTIPHKQTILPYLDILTPRALKIGAVNTLYWEDEKLVGDNTDIIGFTTPLTLLQEKINSALILGSGGASRAVIVGLKDLSVSTIYLTNRTQEKARSLAREFDLKTIAWEERYEVKADLLVNTTPLGMHGKWENHSPWDKNLSRFKIVYDLIYNPLQTRLLIDAQKEGCKTISGLSMFVYQALEQFRIWTGQEFCPSDAMNYLRQLMEHRS